jgi:NADPH-dependent 2,4-dienoyl-CoA reductase/sulfur reductase-like enzyme
VERLIVVGGVAAGTTAATKSRRCCPDAQITVYDKTPYVAYSA